MEETKPVTGFGKEDHNLKKSNIEALHILYQDLPIGERMPIIPEGYGGECEAPIQGPLLLTKTFINVGDLSSEEYMSLAVRVAAARDAGWDEIKGKQLSGDLYTKNLEYLAATTEWDSSERKQRILILLLKHIPRHVPVIDLGCASGMTGMTLLMHGYEHVTFCDFEGIQLDFLRIALPLIKEFEGRWKVVPYGKEEPTDAVVALDVLEHVGKHLNFMRWVFELSKDYLALSYPLNQPFDRPYQFAVDGWVDDEAICGILAGRWSIFEIDKEEGGRFALVRHRMAVSNNPFYDLGTARELSIDEIRKHL